MHTTLGNTDTMRYDGWVHAHMTGTKMGTRNFVDDRPYLVGELVTGQHGGAGELLGTVQAVDGDQVTVEWTSQHIGPVRSTTTHRKHLVHTSHSTHGTGTLHGAFGTGIAAWLLKASEFGWHVCGHAGSGSPTSGYYDGWVSAWLWGTHITVRFNKDGEITWVRTLSQKGTHPSALVIDGPGAGHCANMWLIPTR